MGERQPVFRRTGRPVQGELLPLPLYLPQTLTKIAERVKMTHIRGHLLEQVGAEVQRAVCGGLYVREPECHP